MPRLIVLMGIPGSGKSTWAEAYEKRAYGLPMDVRRVSPGEVRRTLCGDASDQGRNDEVFKHCHELVRKWLSFGCTVVFDATSVTRKARHALLQLAEEAGAQTQLVLFRTHPNTALEWNRKRDRVVPDSVIVRMAVEFERALHTIVYEHWDFIENVWLDPPAAPATPAAFNEDKSEVPA